MFIKNVERYLLNMRNIHTAWEAGMLTGEQAAKLLNDAYTRCFDDKGKNSILSKAK